MALLLSFILRRGLDHLTPINLWLKLRDLYIIYSSLIIPWFTKHQKICANCQCNVSASKFAYVVRPADHKPNTFDFQSNKQEKAENRNILESGADKYFQ